MAISIYLGGTTGAKDGTLEVTGDGVGAELYGKDSVTVVHFRAENGKKTLESIIVPAPLDCKVSKDGVNYDSSVTYAAGEIQDKNVSCYFERITVTQAAPRLEIKLSTYPHCLYVLVGDISDITPPVLSGALTATAGAGQVALDWADATDNSGVTGYDIEYGTTTSYGSSATSVGSSATITGLTGNTLYYFRVRAFDAAGNKSDWLTASATTLRVVTQSSSGKLLYEKFDSGLGALVTAGGATATVSNGKMVALRTASMCLYDKVSAQSDTTDYMTAKVALTNANSTGALVFLQSSPLYYYALSLAQDGVLLAENDAQKGVYGLTVGLTEHSLAFKHNGAAFTGWIDGTQAVSWSAAASMTTSRCRVLGSGAASGDGVKFDDVAWHASYLITANVPAGTSYKLRVRDTASTSVYTSAASTTGALSVDISGCAKVLDVVEILNGTTNAVIATLTNTDNVFGGDVYSYA